MTTSTMFLNKVTVIDHAELLGNGVVGESYNLNVTVEGDVDEHEHVVIDFSTVKKLIKSAVDDRETGYDHKLWIYVPSDVALVTRDSWGNDISTAGDNRLGDSWSIKSALHPENKLFVPKNAVKFIYPRKPVAEQIADHIQSALVKEYPDSNIKVSCDLDKDFNLPSNIKDSSVIFPFSYVHGLKSSSSWGCQNIAHGHRSFLAVHFRNRNSMQLNKEFVQGLFKAVVEELNGSVLIWNENLSKKDKGSVSLIYSTLRGLWMMSVSHNSKYIIMDRETTVENLASWVEQVVLSEGIRKTLREMGADYMLVSEGLSKGAKVMI